MKDNRTEFPVLEPQRTAVARAGAGERFLRRQYPDTDVEVQHSPNGETYYRYEIRLFGISIPVCFGTREILKLNGKTVDAWGSEFVARVEWLKMHG